MTPMPNPLQRNRKLTAKQEAFAVAVAKGATASDAYRQSYDAENMSQQVLWNRASELFKHGGVSVRIEQLRAPVLAEHEVSVAAIIAEAAKFGLGQASESLSHADKRGYLDMLAKMRGAYEKDNKQKTTTVAIQVVLE